MKIHKHSTNTTTTDVRSKQAMEQKKKIKWRHVFIFFSVLYYAFASIVYDVLIKHNNNNNNMFSTHGTI